MNCEVKHNWNMGVGIYGLTGVVSSPDTKFYALALRPYRKYFSLSQQGARIKIWSGDETKQVGHLWLSRWGIYGLNGWRSHGFHSEICSKMLVFRGILNCSEIAYNFDHRSSEWVVFFPHACEAFCLWHSDINLPKLMERLTPHDTHGAWRTKVWVQIPRMNLAVRT